MHLLRVWPQIRIAFILVVMALGGACKKAEIGPPLVEEPFEMLGADVSYLPDIRANSFELGCAEQPKNALNQLKLNGWNTIRLRLWHSPNSPESGLDQVAALAEEAHSLGLKVLLTIHYSDTWADPGHQTKPAAWNGMGGDVLLDSVYQYTYRVVGRIQPDFVQIGNEINGGMLWPEGRSSNAAYFFNLLDTGLSASKAVMPDCKTVLHYAGYRGACSFAQWLQQMPCDYWGLSYYPIWHGKSLDSLKSAVECVYASTGKRVFLAEISYPFTLSWNDWTHNIVGDTAQLLNGFPPNPQGQMAYVQALRSLMKEANGGSGICYWGAEWVSYRGAQATNGSSWENQALWDFNAQCLPVMQAFK